MQLLPAGRITRISYTRSRICHRRHSASPSLPPGGSQSEGLYGTNLRPVLFTLRISDDQSMPSSCAHLHLWAVLNWPFLRLGCG